MATTTARTTNSPAVSFWRLLALYPAVWLATIPLACWLGDFTKLRVRLESLAYPALLLIMFAAPAVQKLWRDTPPVPRWSAVVLLLFLVNAQLLGRNEITYPAPSWNMYAAKRPIPLNYTELIAVRSDGTRVAHPVNQHVAATRAFYGLVNDCMDKERAALKAGDPAAAGVHHANWNRLLLAVADHIEVSGSAPTITGLEYVCRHLGHDGAVLRTDLIATIPFPVSPEATP